MANYALSVVIPTYNRPQLVQRAVASVLAQADAAMPIEVIVVDDASATPLPAFSSPHVRTHRMASNGGPGPAKMQGMRMASAPLALMLDDDDTLRVDAVRTLFAALARQALDAFPVVQFACGERQIEGDFCQKTFADYMAGRVLGDFTPVFRVGLFLQSALSYPDSRVGGEHLLWWRVTERYGAIPSFAARLVDVSANASIRLTDPSSQIRHAEDHLMLADTGLAEFGERLRAAYPLPYRRLMLARFTYAALSGRPREARASLVEMPLGRGLKLALRAISYLPLPVVRAAFLLYRRSQRLAHAH